MKRPFQEELNYYGVSRKYAAKLLKISEHKMGCFCRLHEPLSLYNSNKLDELKNKLRGVYENGEIKKEWSK